MATTAWIFLALLAFCCGCSTYRDLRPGNTEVGRDGVVIPAQLIGNHFVVETKWDRAGPWRFLVDTGSSVTIVSPEFGQRYAEDRTALAENEVKVRSAGGDSTLLPSIKVRRISLGDARFDNVNAVVKNLDEISAHLGVRIDGILGFPLFRNTVFTLDYPKSRLVLRKSLNGVELTGVTIKFNNARRTPLIPVDLGNTTLIVLIDSGSDGPLILNPFGLDLKYAVEPRPGTRVGTLVGDREQEIGRLAAPLRIGEYVFAEPIVDLTDQLSALGGEVLRHFEVTFDQAQNQVTFHRENTDPIKMPSRRSSGMAFSKGPVYWRVVGVVPGSPADKAGVKDGDLVTRINGESIAYWTLQRFEPFVRRNSEIVFTFIDGSKEKPVVIPTFELLP